MFRAVAFGVLFLVYFVILDETERKSISLGKEESGIPNPDGYAY